MPQSPPIEKVIRVAVRPNIFPKNAVEKKKKDVLLPEIGDRIEETSQLVACLQLLADHSASVDTHPDQKKWVRDMRQYPLEEEHLRQLVGQMVDKFKTQPTKDTESIREIVLLGPILEINFFQSLLNGMLAEFDNAPLMTVGMLQGLVQLVQDAPPGYLHGDDLIQILRIIKRRLEDTAQQSEESTIFLALALSKVLDVIASQEVQGLDREQEYQSLLDVLSGLKVSNNPFLKYQAQYAFQALHWALNDETSLQRSLRQFAGLARGPIKGSSEIQLDFKGFLEGLQDIQETAWNTIGAVESGWETVPTLNEDSQEGVLGGSTEGFKSEHKHPWYLTLRGADALVRQGHLACLNKLICEAPCRQHPSFLWGIYQLLGKIAVDPSWDISTRSQATTFLGELNKSIADSGQYQDLRKWRVSISMFISDLPLDDPDTNIVKEQAYTLFQDTEMERNLGAIPFPPPLEYRLPLPRSSLILKSIHDSPGIDLMLDRLRRERLGGYNRQAVYIDVLSKPTLQAADDTISSLKERIGDFLHSENEVMLILGDSGAGKSTFIQRLEHDLWEKHKAGDPIPLYIDLKTTTRPDKDMVRRQLSHYKFSDEQIDEMRKSSHFTLICDGYDECGKWSNLHTNNSLNRPRQWNAKMIVTCRTQYLVPNYRNYFQPEGDRDANFQEAVIVPFNTEQINEYTHQHAAASEVQESFDAETVWSAEKYLERFREIPHLLELAKNPFMLRMILDTLPRISRTTTKLTRAQLYDEFVEMHFENEMSRLIEQRSRDKLGADRMLAFNRVEGEEFIVLGLSFSKRLAQSIFKELGGVNSVDYSPIADHDSWKEQFFGHDAMVKLLRLSSPLVCRANDQEPRQPILHRIRMASRRNVWSFSHRSLLEYFQSCLVYDPRGNPPELDLAVYLDSSTNPSTLANHPFGAQSLMCESSIIHFLVERVQQSQDFKSQLLAVIQLSRTNSDIGFAAANAITILVCAGVHFNGADLREIRIPGADVTGGQFDSSNLQGADLTGVNMTRTWLRQADFSQALMREVSFGEKPSPPGYFLSSTVSLDGKWLAVQLPGDVINVLDTTSWRTVQTLRDTGFVESASFSTSGSHMATGDRDDDGHLVRVWDVSSGELVHLLKGHIASIKCTAFSPNGRLLASGALDASVQIWKVKTGKQKLVLLGHRKGVTAIAWSPNGLKIASASTDGIIRIWKTTTGRCNQVLQSEPCLIWSIVYSPDGERFIASSGNDIWLWTLDGNSNKPIVMKGHTDEIVRAAVSADGRWIASASSDYTIRLWDGHSGAWVATMSGHRNRACCVGFLNDRELVSGSHDQTVRIWDISESVKEAIYQSGGAGIGQKQRMGKGHDNGVFSLAYRTNGAGHSILATVGQDGIVREWDASTGATKIILNVERRLHRLAYSPDGRQMALSCGDVSFFDIAEDGQTVPAVNSVDKAGGRMAYSACGHWMATGDHKGLVRLWDLRASQVQGGEAFVLKGHTNYIEQVAFSPNGLQLASLCQDHKIQLWDRGNIDESFSPSEIVPGYSRAFGYSPCGKRLAFGDDEVVRVWDSDTKESKIVLMGFDGPILCIAWSPCGQWIAAGSHDETVQLKKVRSKDGQYEFGEDSGTTIVLRCFLDMVECLAWSTTAPLEFATGSYDSSVCVWRIEDNEEDTGSKARAILVWGAFEGRLMARDANISEAIGLTEEQRKLLAQRDAIDESLISQEV